MHALLLSLAMASAPLQAPPAHFQIAFTRTSTGYAAECTSGCKWITLSFTCGAECRAVIDESGVRIDADEEVGGAAFAFRFHRTAEGFELASLGGTGWVNLSWSCGLLPCAAHVTEQGVSGSAVGG